MLLHQTGPNTSPAQESDRWHQQADAGMAWVSVAAEGMPPFDSLLERVARARAAGFNVKPIIPGPLSLLWSMTDGDEAALEQLDGLLDGYDSLLLALGKQGVEWVELDEPQLARPLAPVWTAACEHSYNRLQRTALKRLLAVSGGALVDNLGLACNLPVDALQIELRDPERALVTVLDRLPAYKALSLVLPASDLSAELVAQLQGVYQRLGPRLWLAATAPRDVADLAVRLGNSSRIAA
ncbi:5-methyltetrahydropteroyltriglutamate--homocysteine methyltransferase [Halopseudomonas oceani]|uniref:5-methyltetrahydropteroyltriglutamate-- homocysteine methyltransferase n=1 Tax=Halopseudomonas oceani TaxID=1708783 RepID=UPI002AA83B96|nr:5-methyltetrahydropteroyltriglutamate--homocysteine methyltransferase [Halopseudomonas oceani]